MIWWLLILKYFKSKRFTKVKLLLVFGLPLDLKMFVDHKRYHLNNVIYMQIMVGTLAICETTEVLIVKYQAQNSKNNGSFLI